jgi:hypothetical protein
VDNRGQLIDRQADLGRLSLKCCLVGAIPGAADENDHATVAYSETAPWRKR